MLEQLDLTDDERQALESDRDAITALADKLADVPTPAGPTPVQLGTTRNSVSLTALHDNRSDNERDGRAMRPQRTSRTGQ
jgi:hypothetical protein